MIKRLMRTTVLAGAVAMGAFAGMSPTTATASEPFLGTIQFFGFNFAPRGWALCQGQLLPIAQNTALFSLLGTTYGGDGRTTFGLPDLRGRAPIGMGQGPGLSSRVIGQRGGTENETLTVAQMPSHNHTVMPRGSNAAADTPDPTGKVPANLGRVRAYNGAPNVDMGAATSSNTGGNASHNNMPPYLALNCSIALVGIFPSRN